MAISPSIIDTSVQSNHFVDVRRRLAIAGAIVGCLVLAGAGLSAYLLGSHHAPAAFGLSSATGSAGASGMSGKWKVVTGSEVGYRVREQFINQPAPTEAVARTSSVTGGMQIAAAGGNYKVTAVDFVADLSTLVSQDQYARFQTYQRDFFIRTIYLETAQYPKAEFHATTVEVAINLAPGPATIDVSGRLTVHGVTKSVTTRLQAQATADQIEIVGSIDVDMRDYNISPPDISFTKAEPGVVIEYHLVLGRA